MDYCLSRTTILFPRLQVPYYSYHVHDRLTRSSCFGSSKSRSPSSLVVVASAEAVSSLNTPLVPGSLPGKFLSGVLQNERQCFHVAVAEQLRDLADDRDAARARMNLSYGSASSSESCLHRRIAELKEHDCQIAVEEIMYLLIFYKFSEIRVHLVPRLSRCIYNGRLEIWPSTDWALECIHSFEVLEMIKEHLTTVLGWKPNSNVTENWATTQIRRFHLGQIYAASILFGYFLKSASTRHHLEMSLLHTNHDHDHDHDHDLPSSNVSGFWSYGLKDLFLAPNGGSSQPSSLGQASTRQEKTEEKKLKCYVMGFDPETLQRCAKLKSKEAVNLVEKHSCALFGDEKTGLLETDDVISTSFSSMKRLVLEAVAFGSFLWDTEEFVDSVYKLKEN